MQSLRWIPKRTPAEDEVNQLRTAINASTTLATILAQRGLHTFNEVKEFFQPSVRQLHAAFLMKDMDRAVDRITTAINRQENILVYGDYDVDGTSAVALLYGFLTEHYDQVSYYIPDRYKEGYGVSYVGIDFASDNDIGLIIALDCGVKAVDQVLNAKEKGIDFIICDHHVPGKLLPDAVAILNPLQEDCTYPFKHLCGCAIGFKLIQALSEAWDLERTTPFRYVDLVAIATGADIVPMVGENRTLVHLGLRSMEGQLKPGLAELLERQGLAEYGRFNKSEMTVSDLVFKIGPRINAAGRMEHGSIAVELLNASTSAQAKQFAELLDQHNAERKEEDERVKLEALEMIENSAFLQTSRSTVVHAAHWHKGVVGIAASRLQDEYYRPTIVLTTSNGKITGSARSVKGFDVHAAIEACADLLENFGGHPAAAGLTMVPSNLEPFIERFEEVVHARLTAEQAVPVLEYDLEIDLTTIQPRLIEQLNRLAPFGPGNPKPVFVTRNLVPTSKCRRVGEDRSHLKIEVHPMGQPKQVFDGIAFGKGAFLEEWSGEQTIDLAYTLEWNEFRGVKRIQLMVRDIHFERNVDTSSSKVEDAITEAKA
jgi:single-stranded-DNA-specific exonuclease